MIKKRENRLMTALGSVAGYMVKINGYLVNKFYFLKEAFILSNCSREMVSLI